MPTKNLTIAQKQKYRTAERRRRAAQREDKITEEVPWSTYSASASSQASASSHHPDPVLIGSEDELATGAQGIGSLSESQTEVYKQFGKNHGQVNEHWKKDQKVILNRSHKTKIYENAYEKSESTTVRKLEGYGTKLLGNI
jgi:phage I-like protein